MIEDIVIIIPAYNPDAKFMLLLSDLYHCGYRKIIVIDDGSSKDARHWFDEAVDAYGCALVRHGINLGQGRAYKSGFNYYLNHKGTGEYYADTIV